MTNALHLIDAFADEAFRGNPAAVVLLGAARTDEWMQAVAAEMNQAETAFLRLAEDGFALRWFTPVAEVDLCGHATLASAHFLWTEQLLTPDETARFHTRSGLLTARRDANDWITLDFPAIPRCEPIVPDDLVPVLGAEPVSVHGGAFDLLCVLSSADAVRTLTPDLHRMAKWDVRGVLVTAATDADGIDFVSRCFFPRLGVPEDPVTGSAHCALAPYWHDVTGRATLTGLQASRRGGVVRCKVVGDRVHLAGRAVTTVTGTLLA
ncbi:MAG: PhzF family phenazine biosynthesis protein [Gemmatimonadales bacterium]